jgi:spermidine synthase
MIPWQILGSAQAPDGGTLTLYQRDHELVIRVDGRELMTSRAHGSEEALAHLGCSDARAKPRPRVLVGGLGMGFTLRAALDVLPAQAEVVVAEIVPAVVEWNRGPLAHLAGRPLEDPRVTVAVTDVGALLRRPGPRFDAILLDVDNGPQGLTRRANHALYGRVGLDTARRALAPGGCYALWSAGPDRDFERRLARAGFGVEVHEVRARPHGQAPRHVIFLGKTQALRLG